MSAREQGPPRYELRIDELVLEGFAPGDRRAVAAAMESELTRLLSGPDAPFTAVGARGFSVDSLNAGAFSIAAGASPAAVGVAAARAVGRSLGALSRGGLSAGKGSGAQGERGPAGARGRSP
ncbi:MAG: hypothetical protein HYS06_07195 [Methylocystis sp.]|nr:hypothetical protein [Methylocystis sp.]